MKKFYQDVRDYVGATFLLKVVGLISFLYIGKLLPPSEFGYFGMASVIVALGAMLAQFGAPGMMLRNFHLEGGRTLIKALPLALVLWFGEALSLRILGGTLGRVNESFRGTADHPYLIGSLALTATLNVLLSSYLITSLSARAYVVATTVRSVVYLGCVVVLVTLERTYLALLYATLAGDLAFVASSLLHSRSRFSAGLRELFSLSPMQAILDQAKGGFIFFSRDVAGLVQSQLARIILSAYVPVAEVGVYTYFFNIMISLSQIPSAFQQAYTPRLVAAYQENPSWTGNLLSSLIPVWAIGLTVGYGGVVAAGELGLYRLAFHHDYVSHVALLDAMLFVVVSGAMLQTFYFSYYVGSKNTSIRTHALTYLTIYAGLQFFLIPTYGLRGAVIADVTGSTLQLVSLLVINYRLLVVGSTPKDLGNFVVFATAATILVITMVWLRTPWGVLPCGVAALSFVYSLPTLPRFRRVYASFSRRDERRMF